MSAVNAIPVFTEIIAHRLTAIPFCRLANAHASNEAPAFNSPNPLSGTGSVFTTINATIPLHAHDGSPTTKLSLRSRKRLLRGPYGSKRYLHVETRSEGQSALPNVGPSNTSAQRSTEPPPVSKVSSATSDSVSSPLRKPTPSHPKKDVPSRLGTILSLGPVLFDPVRTPRNPIVLAHGLYGFAVRGPTSFPRFQLHYWGELLAVLRDRIGARVVVGRVPGTGAVKDRAEALHAMLCKDESLKGKDVNILAHSMGGLDCRHLLTHIRPTEYRPVSLTTVCTPHRGSPFMEWCQANIGVGTGFGAVASSAIESMNRSRSPPPPFSLGKPILGRSPPTKEAQAAANIKASAAILPSALSSYLLNLLDSPAYSNLHPSFLNDHFNPTTPDVEGVKYFSVAGRSRKMSVLHPLWLPKTILDAHEERLEHLGTPMESKGNDGLVTVESAKWGDWLGVMEGADHWEMRGGSGFLPPKLDAPIPSPTSRAAADVTAGSGMSRKPSANTVSPSKSDSGWGWQEVNATVGKWLALNRSSPPLQPTPKTPRDDLSGLDTIAQWITRRIPQSAKSADSAPSPARDDQSSSGKPSALAAPPRCSKTADATAGAHRHSDPEKRSPDPRLLYGATPPTQLKFQLDAFYGALCRNLYDHGL